MRQVHGMEQKTFACNVFFPSKTKYFLLVVIFLKRICFLLIVIFLKEKKNLFACLTRFVETEIH